MESPSWERTQLSKILPLDEDSLQQVLDYTSALSKDAAAEHLKNLLGDSPKALEFISSYNSRRDAPTASTSSARPHSGVPKPQARKKGKQPLNKLPAPRRVENYGNTTNAYQKKEEEDYMTGRRQPSPKKDNSIAGNLALSDKMDAKQQPKFNHGASLKPPPSASGPLISDLPNVKSGSKNSSRTSSPGPKATVNVPGGASMHGASTTMQDLESAIRSLETQTNPSLSSNSSSARACQCNATRHPLLAAAPNCLNCGKIICVKEGIGPCTYCGTPLLSSAEITGMIDSLKQERGQERMQINNASHRRADVANAPRPFANPTPTAASSGSNAAFDLAKEHRDRLLGYQAENARRTQIIDEASDYETPSSGLSQWASPVERAAQLKRQQKILREQEWNAKPEYEKRKVVVSVDLVGGKVVKRMANADKPQEPEILPVEEMEALSRTGENKGTFSQNPHMGNLIRPVWKSKGKESGASAVAEDDKENQPRANTWRKVQDDNDDNEAWILDGGLQGGKNEDMRLGAEEPSCG